MSSLKRLLNDESNENPGQGFVEEQSTRHDYYNGFPIQSEMPALPQISWSGLWDNILSVNVADDNDPFWIDMDGASGSSMDAVEQSIESWATQYMPMPMEHSSHSQGTPFESLNSGSPGGSPTLLCYGMIYRTAVRVKGDMQEIDRELKVGLENHLKELYTFNLQRSLTNLEVRFSSGMLFGVLNVHVTEALKGIIERHNLYFEAIGSIPAILETIGRVTKANDAVVRVNINIYGPTEFLQEIGRRLSSQKIYLQRPDQLRHGSEYQNPHVISFPDMVPSSYENEHDVQSIKNKHWISCYNARTGRSPPEFCLWKAMEGENEGWYLHAVTKQKNRVPAPETGGGILADEMGMGKSLSTLGLITKTLDKAHAWVQQEKSSPEKHSREKFCRATLILVPSATLINEWFNEVKLHLDGTLTILRYHGPKRKTLAFEDADIVVTTYHTIVSDFSDKSSPLHGFEWYRVVLDEAHIIRRPATRFFRAVTELKARFRWCLTGTPIQNKLEDIGALFAFIRANPFHSLAMFRRFVSIPYDESEERREVATTNLTLLLESLCLRRSRDLLNLPTPQYRIRILEFSPEERQQYEHTKKIMNRTLRQRAGESYSKNIFGMFQIQLQLRILCNHGTYQQPFSWARRDLQDEREDALCSTAGHGEVHCSACRQSLPLLASNDLYLTYPGSCTHVVCKECVEQNEQTTGEMTKKNIGCPLCTASGVYVSVPRPNPLSKERDYSYLRQKGRSSKIMALLSDIQEELWQTKSLVFSCWTNTLNLIEIYLQKEAIPFRRIDGDSSHNRRQKILKEFSRSSDIPVLIMTTGTGAQGLNLPAANRVFIVEPQWNPSVEHQAASRAIRLNQTKPVLVTRYLIKESVEQEMDSQQRRKLIIADIGNNNLS